MRGELDEPRHHFRFGWQIVEEHLDSQFVWQVHVVNERDKHRGASRDPFRTFFEARTAGRGIWKWQHYFEAYQRHLQRFAGRRPVVVEIGVLGGGSLDMWHECLGPGCQVHGVDVRHECQAFEDERTRIHIGDQADREFWRRFKAMVPRVDVLIDDGGHELEQQRSTLEEMLPHLQPGGIYICEDVHGMGNPFFGVVAKLADELNAFDAEPGPKDVSSRLTPLQQSYHSVHFYPFMVVIEKRHEPLDRFVAVKRGTLWQSY